MADVYAVRLIPLGNKSVCLLRIALALSLCGACAQEDVVEVGIIGYVDGTPSITVPMSVPAGVDAQFLITTQGGGCITLDSTEVKMDEDGADITPFDRRRIPDDDHPCLAIAAPLGHEGVVSFNVAGTKTLRFHGRRLVPDAGKTVDMFYEVAVDLTVE